MVSEAQRWRPLCSVISGFSMCGLRLSKAMGEIRWWVERKKGKEEVVKQRR